MSSASSSCSVVSDSDLSADVCNQRAENAALDEMKNLVLSDALVAGKIVEMGMTDGKKTALVKWCNHSALTWIDYDVARIRFPDIVLDYYESILVFDDSNLF